ncbi:hypothetical protein Y046_3902 [Burkholderia pseudomallei MSHR2990]|nr:hypothetical protein Y046_3902 [Burkholderia pseudomallei MSHR2990]
MRGRLDQRDRRDVQHGRHAECGEGPERLGLDLARCVRQLGDADRHRQRRVLDQVHVLAEERRQRDAHRLRQHDEAKRLQRRQAERARRVMLAGRHAAQPRLKLLGDERARVAAQAEPARDELERRPAQREAADVERMRRVEPRHRRLGQQRGDAEIPEQQLHDERRVAKRDDVRGRRAPRRCALRVPGDREREARERRRDGRRERQAERQQEALP